MTAEIKELAHQYGPDALQELFCLAKHAESEQARVAACKEILDRANGKSVQPIHGQMTYGMSQQLADLFRGNHRHGRRQGTSEAKGNARLRYTEGDLVTAALALGATRFVDENIATSTLIKELELVAEAVDVKTLHAKIGELTLEKVF